MSTSNTNSQIKRSALARRDILSRGFGLGALGLAGTFTNLQLISAAAAQNATDYKAIVCIFLYGGNDSFNFIAPRDPLEYQNYLQERRSLAIPLDQLDASPCVTRNYADGRAYGFNPLIEPLVSLYNNRDLAFMVNVGTLLAPITKAQYQSRVNRPSSLYSHNDQQYQWQGALGATTGWGGRIADLLDTESGSTAFLTSVSTAGSNTFQVGDMTQSYSLGGDGLGGLRLPNNERRRAHLELALRQLAMANEHPFARALGAIRQRSYEVADEVNAALQEAPTLATEFPDSSLGRQLQLVARMASIGPQLGLQRQVFFCATGGYDTHNNQVVSHPHLLGDLSQSMVAFHSASQELGMGEQITTMTGSDFGRTFNTNSGDGSDHGWGGVQMVMGNAVNGRDFYGSMPDFVVGGEYDSGRRGTWIPAIAVDQMISTLSKWFGVSASELSTVVPNISAFDSDDLGFMSEV